MIFYFFFGTHNKEKFIHNKIQEHEQSQRNGQYALLKKKSDIEANALTETN